MNDTPYSLPEIYEIAFSFRDYPKTVDSIIAICAKAGLTRIESAIELGCGPGQYCREFARRKIQSYGIDLSSEMVSYVKARSAFADQVERLRGPLAEIEHAESARKKVVKKQTRRVTVTANQLDSVELRGTAPAPRDYLRVVA